MTKRREQKGSIGIFVLIALLFMISFLIISFASNINKSKLVKEQFDIINGIYASKDGEQNAYNKAYTALINKNKKILTASVENNNTLELTNTLEENIDKYKIYGYGLGSFIPNEYQQVEYIESTGGQYIDTNFKPNEKTTLEVKAKMLDFTDYPPISNSRNQPRAEYFGVAILSSTEYRFLYGSALGDKTTTESVLREINTYKLNKNKAYLNGTLVHAFGNSTFQVNYNLYIFADNIQGSIARYSKCQIYSYKIWDDGVLVRDLVPCYRKSDNVIGLYDKVNDVFYTNQGTGEFSKGVNTGDGVGDCITDESSTNYGKYLIPIKLTNENNESTIINIILDKPLKSTDYIDCANQKVVRNVVGKLVLTGNETWANKNNCMQTTVKLPEDLTSENSDYGISNYYRFNSVHTNISTLLSNGEFGWNTVQCLTIKDKNYTTTASWKKHLAELYNSCDPILIYYKLADPIEETINLPKLRTFDDYTKIEVLTEIVPSKIEVEYTGYTLN